MCRRPALPDAHRDDLRAGSGAEPAKPEHRPGRTRARRAACGPALALLLSTSVPAVAAAEVETWNVLVGSLTDVPTGETRPLGGSFAASPSAADPPPLVLHVEEFALEAGGQAFAAGGPADLDVFAEGRAPRTHLLDILVVDGDAVERFSLHTGEERLAETEQDATVRFLRFGSEAGRAIGAVGEDALPRRIEVSGTLHEIEQDLHAVETCSPVFEQDPGPIRLPPPRSAGGSVILGSGRSLASSGGSRLPGHLTFARGTPAPTPPSLEELGIAAAAAADVTMDVSGALRVESTGDLVLHGMSLDLPGLTSVTISTLGDIFVEGPIQLPADVALSLEAQGSVDVADGVPPLFDPPLAVDPSPVCHWLVTDSPPRQRLLGHFRLVASAARPVDVELLTGRGHDRLQPGVSRRIRVALLGSERLDVRDVVPSSLRLGEAAPLPGRRHGAWTQDTNRDGHDDLVALFDLRQTGLAYGDIALCLLGETVTGEQLEGCAAVDTRPRVFGRSAWGAARAFRHRLLRGDGG